MAVAPAAELAFFLYCDVSGLARGRAVPATDLERRLEAGVGWVPANQALTPFGEIADPNPWGSVGDLRLRPDPTTRARVDLWADASPLHLYVCDAVTPEGEPWDSCPRTLLAHALAELESEAGVSLVAAFEHEFHLELPGSPATPPPAFSLEALRSVEPFAPMLLAALDEAGIEVETLLPEYGPRQLELSCAPRAGLRAADEAVLARELVRETARRGGGRASFTPIVQPDQPGNGLHVHFSFPEATYDPSRPGCLSELAGTFAAGILAHLPALCALAAPAVVSYLRLAPHRWSAGHGMLALRNREAALRIPPVRAGADPAAQAHLELRVADGACCPHLALAGLVLAGLDGLRRGLAPARIVDADPDTLTGDERRRLGIVELPSSLADALDALEADEVARSWLSPDLLAGYVAAKRTEITLLAGADDTRRCDAYRDAY